MFSNVQGYFKVEIALLMTTWKYLDLLKRTRIVVRLVHQISLSYSLPALFHCHKTWSVSGRTDANGSLIINKQREELI